MNDNKKNNKEGSGFFTRHYVKLDRNITTPEQDQQIGKYSKKIYKKFAIYWAIAVIAFFIVGILATAILESTQKAINMVSDGGTYMWLFLFLTPIWIPFYIIGVIRRKRRH